MTFGAPRSTVSGVRKVQGGVPKPRSGCNRRCQQRRGVLGSGSGLLERALSLHAARLRSGLGPRSQAREAAEGGYPWGSADRCPLRRYPGTAPSPPRLPPSPAPITSPQRSRGGEEPSSAEPGLSARPALRGVGGRGRGLRTPAPDARLSLTPSAIPGQREPCPRYWGSGPRCRTPAPRWG